MVKTEKYNITFCGRTRLQEAEDFADEWNKIAREVSLKTKVFVEAVFEEEYEKCKSVECKEKLKCIRLRSIREPGLYPIKESYAKSIVLIVEKLREYYNEAYTTVEVTEIDIQTLLPSAYEVI
ncbi:hypothetical protein ACTQ6A_01000 [Lachnospiraceae bacterium LCP25S3_G4]